MSILNNYHNISLLNKSKDILRQIESKDHQTFLHSIEVGFLTKTFVNRYMHRILDSDIAFIGALLHDCGKLRVPDLVFSGYVFKNKNDYDLIHKHPGYAKDILTSLEFPEEIIETALYHHENYNGTGYGYGKTGVDIPILARVIRITDSVCALTEDRPYREKYNVHTAIRLLIKDSEKYDIALLKLFIENINSIMSVAKLESRKYAVSFSHGHKNISVKM